MADHNETHCETWYPSISIEPGALYCPPKHDGIICWPATRANTTAYRLCIDLPRHEDDPVIPGNTQAHAHRTCLPSGEWLPYTNYSECLDAYANYSITTQLSTQPPEQDITRQAARTLSMIIFIGSTVSLVVLLLSLLIFLKFKSLQCQRTSIHKHLIMSFIIRFTIITVMVEPFVFGHNPWYKEMEWLCRTLTTIQYFSIVANFCWMLVEGLYLHLILVLRPMNNEKAPFIFFHFVGWVIPLLVGLSWAVVTHFTHDTPCWTNHTDSPYMFIIYAPVMITLLINLLILMNLVRIVIAKLCSGNQTERRRICRAMKSTIVLVFLLGIINLMFFLRPDERSYAIVAYRYINAILPPCQGIFVCLLYCVMNNEVRRAVKKWWHRFRDSRSMHNSTMRRRSSRTSMTMFVSNQVQCNGTEQPPVIELQAVNGHGTPLLDKHGAGLNGRED